MSSRFLLNSPTGHFSRGAVRREPFSLTIQGGIPTLKESLLRAGSWAGGLLWVGPPHASHTRALEAALGQHAMFRGVLASLPDCQFLPPYDRGDGPCLAGESTTPWLQPSPSSPPSTPVEPPHSRQSS